MNCPKCNCTLNPGATVCGVCGYQINNVNNNSNGLDSISIAAPQNSQDFNNFDISSLGMPMNQSMNNMGMNNISTPNNMGMNIGTPVNQGMNNMGVNNMSTPNNMGMNMGTSVNQGMNNMGVNNISTSNNMGMNMGVPVNQGINNMASPNNMGGAMQRTAPQTVFGRKNGGPVQNQIRNDDDALVKAFIGKKADKIMNSQFSVCAFFFGLFYLCYRKMYTYTIVIVLLFGAINGLLYQFKINYVFDAVVFLGLGFKFKDLYLKFVRDKVKKIQANNSGKSQSELEEICRKKGGTSIVGLILSILILLVLPIALVFILFMLSFNVMVDAVNTSAIQVKADMLADKFEGEYQLYLLSKQNAGTDAGYEDYFRNVCVTNSCISANGITASYLDNETLTYLRVDTSDIRVNDNNLSFVINSSTNSSTAVSYVAINSSTQRACVKLSTTDDKTVCSTQCKPEQCTSNGG